MKTTNSTEMYQLVMNLQNELSIWPEGKDLPVGWRSTGISGCKQDCLDYITDLDAPLMPCDMPTMERMYLTKDTGCMEDTN
jgi:MbtH protein